MTGYLLNITLAEGGTPFYILMYANNYMEAASAANNEWPECEVRNATMEVI